MKWFERRQITRSDDRPYLDRFYVFRCKLFGIYIHRFLASDDACGHDHPFPYVSLILAGGYWEQTRSYVHRWLDQDGSGGWVWRDTPMYARRWYGPGSVLARRAEHAHRIEIDPARPPLTLVLTGPRVREWGFFGKGGWVPWRRYQHAKHCA